MVEKVDDWSVKVDNYFAGAYHEHPFGAPARRNTKNKLKIKLASSLKVKDERPENFDNVMKRRTLSRANTVWHNKREKEFDVMRTGEYFLPEMQYAIEKPPSM